MFGIDKEKKSGYEKSEEKKWKKYISSANKELQRVYDADVLKELFNRDHGYAVPENLKTQISEVRTLIGEKLLEGGDVNNDILEKIAIAKGPNVELAESATRKLLKSNPSDQNLYNVFAYSVISDEVRREVFEKIKETPEEIYWGNFVSLLDRDWWNSEKLRNFWDDIEKLLFSSQTTSEELFYAHRSSGDNKEIRKKIKNELIKRGLTLYTRYDQKSQKFIPVYRDAHGEEFKGRAPLREDWIAKQLDQPLYSKEDLFEEMENPRRMFYAGG